MPLSMKKEKVVKKNISVLRPPVVVVLGHIDHGKTTLLDTILKTNVAEHESGGITQHVSAYEIVHAGKKVTFIDTPGHEAFSKMRSRGAKIADVGILVVAADDGVKPQTQEVIKMLLETKLPFVVAVNKIDKPGANTAHVKQQLAEESVFVEGYGGQVPLQEISAKTGDGVNELLDLVLLVAELEDLHADPEAFGSGIVIESHLDPRRGVIATLIIKNGSLKSGDFIFAEEAKGKIKILENFLGDSIVSATFSSPVIVNGFESLPTLGSVFYAFTQRADFEEHYKEIVIKDNKKLKTIGTGKEEGGLVFKIILKADTQGSLEAISEAIGKIHSESIRHEIIFAGVGDINETDFKLALTAGAAIFGFRVRMGDQMNQQGNYQGVVAVSSSIIYDLLDDIRHKMEALLKPETQRTVLGKMKVMGVFKKADKGQVVGGRVLEGIIRSGTKCSVIRNEKEIGRGVILEVQHNKMKTNEVKENQECGILIGGLKVDQSIVQGDEIEAFEEKTVTHLVT